VNKFTLLLLYLLPRNCFQYQLNGMLAGPRVDLDVSEKRSASYFCREMDFLDFSLRSIVTILTELYWHRDIINTS